MTLRDFQHLSDLLARNDLEGIDELYSLAELRLAVRAPESGVDELALDRESLQRLKHLILSKEPSPV